MSIPMWYAGNVITADRLNARNMYMVTQENDLVLSETTTLVDTEIVIPVEPGAVYTYWCFISYSACSSSTNNRNSALEFAWSVPSGATMTRFTQTYVPTTTSPGGSADNNGALIIQRRPATGTRIPMGGSDDGGTAPTVVTPGNFHSAYDQGTIVGGSVAGNVVMRVAPLHSTVNKSILRGGNQTRCIYQRIA